MKLLLLRQHKSRANSDGEVTRDIWQVTSLPRGTWLLPSLGSQVEGTGGRWIPELWGVQGDVAAALPLLPPALGASNPPEGLQPLTKWGINHLIKSPQLKRRRH